MKLKKPNFLFTLFYKQTDLALVYLGILLRVLYFLVKKSIGLDETLLAFNVFNKSFYELITTRLVNNQIVPTGFMLISKFFVIIFGEKEFALRIFVLICGVLSVYFFYLLVNLIFEKSASSRLLALALFSCMPILVFYSSEYHPYSVDTLAGTVFTYLTAKILKDSGLLTTNRKSESSEYLQKVKKNIFILGTLGAVFIFLSSASLIIFASNAVVLFLFFFLRKKQDLFKILVGTCLIWLLFFLVNYLTFYSKYLYDDYMLYQWYAKFLLDYETKMVSLRNIVEILISNFNYAASGDYSIYKNPFTWSLGVLLFVSFFIGSIKLLKEKNPPRLFLIFFPFIITLVINLFFILPLEGRHLLYLAPHFVIVSSVGFFIISRIFTRIEEVSQKILITVFIAFFVFVSVYQIFTNFNTENTKGAMDYISENLRGGDFILVHSVTSCPFKYYADRSHSNLINYEFIPRENCGSDNLYKQKAQNHQRIWFLYSFYLQTNPIEDCIKNTVGDFSQKEKLDMGKTHLHLFVDPKTIGRD